MSSTNFTEHSQSVSALLQATVAPGLAQLVHMEIEQKSLLRGYLNAILRFSDDSELHLREFYDGTQSEPRVMYAYHYQDTEKNLRYRYDNPLHRPPVGQKEHKHTATGVIPAILPSLQEIIDEALDYQ